MHRNAVAGRSLVAAMLLAAWAGCGPGLRFPAAVETHTESGETVLAFDMNRDQRPDYWQYKSSDGRITGLAFGDAPGQPGPRMDLDTLSASDCPHFLIVLDGVPFEVVEQLYREGCFRLFYPPARVVCGFPSMTDLALADMFHSPRCLAFQALYFDRQANRLSDSSNIYLSGRNAPWVSQMAYRCSFWWDVLVYLDPKTVFDHELRGILRTLRKCRTDQAYVYTVGTAGLGTRGGRPAIERYLRTIDRLCQQLVYERRGRVKITITADHGHSLVAGRLVSFDARLRAAGYRPTKSLRGPRDVVTISYGLVTYAELFASDPAGVARCLVQDEAVEFACYRDGDEIVVCDAAGRARIRRGQTGFIYDCEAADPLRLAPIVEQLARAGKVAPVGALEEQALFAATLEYYYPDPLARIWDAFYGSVAHPPDLIVNLRDGFCHGSCFFNAMIGKVASTHGSLNSRNSMTFVMTMLGELPSALRSRDVLPALERLRQAAPRTGPQP